MASIPPGADLSQIPAGMPPPGVVPNLVNGYSRGPVFLVFGPIITFFMLCFLTARVYAKFRVMKQAMPDDYACAVASVLTIGYFAIAILALKGNTFGKHIWDVPLSAISTDEFLKISYLSNWFPNLVWLAVKVTFYLLYLQIFRPNKNLVKFIWAGIIVTSLFYVSITIPQLYWASPRPGQSWLDPLEDGSTIKTQALALPIAGFNLGSDIYIFVLPLWGVRNLHMSKKKKLGVVLMFATGFSAVVTSLVALIYKVQVVRDSADYTWTGFPVLITNYTEMVVGISASCMPACSATLRAHSEFFHDLGSRISRLTRSSGSGRSAGTHGNGEGAANGRPYVNIESTARTRYATKRMPSDQTSDDLELRELQGVSANNSTHDDSDLLANRIHVTSEIHQHSERL